MNKGYFQKPTKRSFKNALFIGLIFLILSPIFSAIFTFLSPSVREAINPELGQCDIYYKDKFIPCVTNEYALKKNLKLMLCMSLLSFILFLFLNESNKESNNSQLPQEKIEPTREKGACLGNNKSTGRRHNESGAVVESPATISPADKNFVKDKNGENKDEN